MTPAQLWQLSSLPTQRWMVLTGAGCSTESGIPDYRGEGTRRRARRPIRFQDFVADEQKRRRYWARSMLGWPRIEQARPNPAHLALAELERQGLLSGLVTQNVDGLHQRAGSQQVIELHGSLHEVGCLVCQETEARAHVQQRMLQLNPGVAPRERPAAPDGDAEWEPPVDFIHPRCLACGGELKPSVVFFGESVPRARVEAGYQLVQSAELLLVVGSSLAVFSGYRFVRAARDQGIPIVVINLGESRADELAALRWSERAGSALPKLQQWYRSRAARRTP